ncbi:MAG: hypothetical protein CM15mP74_34900 [Halieaceae bacterium]|nr:MAG: hypothetical protein CM15mP74_34900 [Halieaceae bacterium]
MELALAGDNAVMPSIERRSDRPYRWRIGKRHCTVWPIVKKDAPPIHLKRWFWHSPAGRAYFEPLIAGEAYPGYKNGMPVYTRLKNVLVPKRCEPWAQ